MDPPPPVALQALRAYPNVSLSMLCGVMLCALLATFATLAAPLAGVPVMLAVLLLGIGLRATGPALVARVEPGIRFTARHILRVGVALLGLRVVASDLAALGPRAIGLVLVTVIVTVGGGYGLARLFRQPHDVAAIAATSVAICGASAALAASTAVPSREGLERETCLIIVAVSLLSTLVMLIYPAIAHLLDFDTRATGLLLGAAIHDVAQVAGAGFALSPEIGVQAVTVKMIRVACLLPVVALIGRLSLCPGILPAGAARTAMLPGFLIAFLALALIASSGLMPAPLRDLGAQAAGWALTAAVAAIGLKTALGDLRRVSSSLLFVLIGQTLLQLLTVIFLIRLLFA